MTTALYLRKSRADDPGEDVTVTLRRHEETLRAFAGQNGLTIGAVYREVVSGDRLDGRREMQRLLSDCPGGSFGAVLCMDIDRLGRGSMAEQGVILDTFKLQHILIITPRKTYDLNDDLDETYSEFETFLARQELKVIKRRLQRGILRSLEEGGHLSAPPYGYRRASIGKLSTLEPVPDEAEAVQLIFRLYTAEKLGCTRIADRLNAMGYLPRRSSQFSRTAVLGILSNPVYCGRIVRHQPGQTAPTVDVPGRHSSLVSESVFSAAQALRKSRGHPPTPGRQLQNPLAGLAFCALCGAPLQRLPRNHTRRQETLHCPHPGCNTAVRLGLVEQVLRDTAFSLLPEILTSAPPQPPVAPAVRRQTLEQQTERLYTLVEQGVYTPEEYRRRRQIVEQQKTALLLDAPLPEPVTLPVAAAYALATPAERNALLRLCFDRVLYRKEKGWCPARFELDIILR